MAFEGLTEKLSSAFKKLRNKGRLTESDVKEAMREIRLALLEADVSYKVVKDFIKSVTEKAVGTEVLESLTPAQAIIKIVNQELIELMGGGSTKITISSQPPTIVMMVGLQGAGKTTNAAKLAGLMRKQNGKRPLLVACDIYRPAAIQQLEVVGKQLDLPVFQMGQENPVAIAQAAIEHAKKHGNDMVFLDTAGRLHVDEALMEELQSIKEAVNPSEILLVVDAMIGQDAVNAAKAFDDALDIDGVVLTKLDGDARGGAALSIKAVTGKPILYIGMGEKLSDLEQFYPDRMASRILGMGDVLTLIEKAQETVDEEKAKAMTQKLKKAQFGFDDYLESMNQMKKMGGLSSVLAMMPGLGSQMKDIENAIDEKKMARTEAIILSMTPKERSNPEILNPSRKHRIARGAGVDIAEVNRLVKQFEQMRKMMKQMNVIMPLMSVWFCFTFPAAIGIYWVASSVFMIIQQVIVNAYLNRVDIDEMIRKNVEKANKKRAKKGLPPQKINQNATASLKSMQAAAEKEEALRAEKLEKTKEQVEASNAYYNNDAKPGSIASKANMVARYNEKHNK